MKGQGISRVVRLLAAGGVGLVLLLTGWAWLNSRLPDTYAVTEMHAHAGQHTDQRVPARSVIDFVADVSRNADVKVELVAGTEGNRLTFNATSPGPTIRVQQGDLVEVVLRNQDVPDGVTVHWHGVDVPNAMDGVAGVTQDAVRPGEAFTYRFVAEQVGTFWYHSHQVSHQQVIRGLFGAFVIEPAGGAGVEAVALLHSYPGESRSLNGTVGEVRQDAHPGDRVRVRIANTDNSPTVVWVAEGAYRLLAIDGTDVNEPTEVTGRKLTLTAGARADLEIRVPESGAARVQAPGVSLVVGPPGALAPESPAPIEFLDPLSYGTPAPLGFDPATADLEYEYRIGRRPGFLDGRPGYWWTINGRMGRHVPAFMVDPGDVVVVRLSNRSGEVHPMHLHGHHYVVLERNGVAASGSPWWVDSLNVENGDDFVVGFVADNPGLWMDHCHNLPHAREGLMTHLMYNGVGTPFLLGRASGNQPE